MEKIEWHIKNQNAKYKFSENLSKETSINISKEIFDFLGAKQNGDVVTVIIRKRDFLLAFSKMISNLPLYFYKNGSQKADFTSVFFETNYNEIIEHFGEKEEIQYKIKVRINDESTTRYYLYRIDGAKNFIIRDFLIGENSILNFIKEGDKIIIEPLINIIKKENLEPEQPSFQKATKPAESYEQTIYYGVPGCGKSHLIKKTISDKLKIKNAETQIIRTVFHPEYTNADFVGQILPDLKDKTIVYKFVPGPFSQILKKALLDDKNNYVLIIEEINRGNSAAIFGELFQLLDRIKPYNSDAIGGNSYTEGWSEYFVMNSSINEYIRDAETETEKSEKAIDIFVDGNSKIHFSANTGIRLPPNLSIFATMNTSDQNVFKLDNAFKRRWDLQLVPNEFGGENGKLSPEEESQRDAKVEGFDFTWNEFRIAINKVISNPENSFDSSSFSDKQLGCWFVKAENEKIKKEVFVHKVLEYLWDDVFTFEKTLVFEKNYQTFAELSNSVLKDKKKEKNIFSENFLHILNAQKQKPKDKETSSDAEKSQPEIPENQQNQDL